MSESYLSNVRRDLCEAADYVRSVKAKVAEAVTDEEIAPGVATVQEGRAIIRKMLGNSGGFPIEGCNAAVGNLAAGGLTSGLR